MTNFNPNKKKFIHYSKVSIFCLTLILVIFVHQELHARQNLNPIDSVTFIKHFPNSKVLDHGKLILYTYRDYYDDFHGLWNINQPVTVVAAVALELLESPVDYYCVQKDGLVYVVTTEKEFDERIKLWFYDDIRLLNYIHEENIHAEFLPYLVRMYNSHAPRTFDPDYKVTPIKYFPDGFMDERDCQLYDIIIVNNQTWFAENLQFCKQLNCSDCIECKNNSGYYSWKVASQICPQDWKLPDETDWKTLFLELGLPLERVNKIFGMDKDGALGKKLLKDENNSYGFNAIKAGHLKNGTLVELDEAAYFWTTKEEFFTSADVIEIHQVNKNRTEQIYYKKSKQFNVGCVK